MDYVKHFDINGVDTRQVACIELHGKPNAATEGRVGVLGIDLDSPTHEVYKCVAVNGAIYTWELLSSGLSMISSTLTSGGVEFMQFPYDRLQTPSLYMVKIGDLILDRYGYLYQVTALYSSYCDATYCGIQIVAHCPSGVYLGSETPPEGVEVWVDPSGESGETEEWIFTLEDDTTVTKKQLLIDEHMNVLRVKNADGEWVEVPALIGRQGDPGVGIKSIKQTTTSTEDDGDNIVTVTLTNGVEVTFTVQNGSKGNKGDTGDTGVGVQSVEQTTTSNEDDGNNVITVTLTNGEKFTFTVQNGSKGSTGETGKTGETGADGVSVQSVTQTTTSDADGGDNVITVTLTNGVKSTFIVKNGSKGGTGSPGANGKSAYDYAKDGGFTGTEAEFIAKLATAYLPLSGGTMTGTLYGKTIYQNGKQVANKEDIPTDIVPITVTSTDGVAYAATAPSVKATSLAELKGAKLVIIPNMTSTNAYNVTLNVNGLGAQLIKRWDNTDTSEFWSFTKPGWFKEGYPITVTFNGKYWIIEGMNKPYASDLNGAVAIPNGGTGATTAAGARTNLGLKTETWTFTLEDGTTVTKAVYIG